MSFADLSCLLLTFFVLLFSMSTLNRDKWPEVAAALSQQRDPSSAPAVTAPAAQYNIASTVRKRAIDLDYLHAVLREAMTADPRLAKAGIDLLADRLVISLPGDLLFASTATALSGRSEKALFALGGVLGNITNPIAVVGHAPRGPAAEDPAWELALSRAAAVADVMARSGYTRDISVLGAGHGAAGNGAAHGVELHILAGGG